MDVERRRRAAFAAKTVAASIACVIAFADAPRELRVLVGVSGAFATQFVAGESRATQRTVFIGAGAAFVLLVVAATAIAGPPAHPFARAVLLPVTAFAVFPLRAVLPGRPMFTVFAFTTVLLTLLLAPNHGFFETGVAALTGVVAAYLVHFAFVRRNAPPVDVPLPPRAGPVDEVVAFGADDVLLGLRAGAAMLVAGVVSERLHLVRPYWVELSAVVLITATWHESMRKGVARLFATALGCAAGWLLHAVLVVEPAAVPPVLFACVFLAVYERPVSYARMMFFLSLYVVVLFSIIGQWSIAIAIARVVDTAVGAAIAVVVTLASPRRLWNAVSGRAGGRRARPS